MKHVVIVGGGFAGLNCAKKLAKHSDVRVTLIDKNNYQQFQPLLYQVAAADLSPTNVAFSLRGVILRDHPNVDVKMSEVVSVDLNTRTVHTAEGQTYQGDFLVLAAGSQPNFFGTPGADKHSYPLYSLHDAEALRSRIIAVLECADRDPSLLAKGALNFVIVGAGPTGTEMAGAFGDGLHRALSKAFPDLNFGSGGIVLVDGGHAVLNTFSPESQAYANKDAGGARRADSAGHARKRGTPGPRGALRRDHDRDPHGDLGGRSQGFTVIRQSGNQDWSWRSH